MSTTGFAEIRSHDENVDRAGEGRQVCVNVAKTRIRGAGDAVNERGVDRQSRDKNVDTN